MKPDSITKEMILNESDEYAVSMGCRFDAERAQHVIDFFCHHLCLYEGVDRDENGELPPFVPLPWAEEMLRRVFGWVQYSGQHQQWIRRFQKSFCWVPKKSGKTPIGAGVGLYMWYGLGEEGQHIGFCAKDGKQAERMQRHSKIMAENSPTFADMLESQEVIYNKTQKLMTHQPTNSTMELLTGDNVKSQDGFNGSIMLDECHVIGDDLGKIVNKSGLSRREPLIFGISTAGNLDSVYGRKMYDYGKDVECGKVKDITFFHLAYEADQLATDEDCKKPETWRQANPALGIILSEAEMASDCLQSQRSEADWQDFKQRRLGIWSQGSAGIISGNDWQQAFSDFTEEDLIGQPCYLGMDLSRSLDMTAIVMVFRSNDEKPLFRMVPRIWATERFLRNAKEKANFASWVKEGSLIEIPGKTIDQDYIFDECSELNSRFDVQAVSYDKTYATELAKRLEACFGWLLVEQSQSPSMMTGPTTLFLEELAAGRLKHNGNDCFSWHAGNATGKVRGNQLQIVKPDRGEWKKIDAIVAAVMGLNIAFNGEETAPAGSMYLESDNWLV